MKFIAEWILNAIALLLVSRVIPGIEIRDISSTLLAVIVLGLINILIKPVLTILALPITILTLGVFQLVVNAFLFILASKFVGGFYVSGFLPALFGSIFYSILAGVLRTLVRDTR